MAKQKRIRLRTKLRTTSKVQEKQLIGTGKWLAENPEVLIPRCGSDCRRCDFEKMRQRLKRISQGKDDERFLQKMAKRGPQLSRAYAATLYRAKLGRAEYLAVAKGPEGDIAYMFSPRVKKEALIGVQYFRDPQLRLLSYNDIAKKRRLTFYSVGNGVHCSRAYDRPPSAFIDEMKGRLQLTRKEGTALACSHDLRKKGYLQIDWRDADISIRICEDCLGKKNSIREITQRMITPSLENLFSVSARVRLECDKQCDSCPSDEILHYDQKDVKRYLSGELDDKGMYELATDKFSTSIEKGNYRLASLGMRCFKDDKEALAGAIATDEVELDAVKRLLSRIEFPIVLPEGITPNKLLSQYWDTHGKEVVSEMTGVPVNELSELTGNTTPMGIIEKARLRARSDAVRQSLPEYSGLGPISSLSDRIAREAKTHGREAALKLAAPSGHEQTGSKAIGLAFRIALGETGMNWQYTKEEIDFAKHLAPLARKLIEANGETYDRALRELVSSAGADEKIVKTR
ncbi:MAG: hypothetical protein QXE18_05360 [Thermoplasmata archaeon]